MKLPPDFRSEMLTFLDELAEERNGGQPPPKPRYEFRVQTVSHLEVEPALFDTKERKVVSWSGHRWFSAGRTDAEYYAYLQFAKDHPNNARLDAPEAVFWPATSAWR